MTNNEHFKENMTDVSALSRKLVEKNERIKKLEAELACREADLRVGAFNVLGAKNELAENAALREEVDAIREQVKGASLRPDITGVSIIDDIKDMQRDCNKLKADLAAAQKEAEFWRDSIQQRDSHIANAPLGDEVKMCACRVCECFREKDKAQKEIERLKGKS